MVLDSFQIFRFPATNQGPDPTGKDDGGIIKEDQLLGDDLQQQLPTISGTDGLCQVPPDGSPESTTQLHLESRRSYAILLRSRRSSTNAHAEAQMALRRYSQLRLYAQQSQGQFMQLMKEAQADGNWEHHSKRLCEQSERLATDLAALEAHVARLQTCLGRLGNLDFKARDLEKDTYGKLDSLVRQLGLIDHLNHDEITFIAQFDKETQSTTSTELDPLLETYYCKAEMSNALREKLVSIEIEHQESKAFRELLTDQDRPVSCSESQFERDHRERKQGLHRQIEVANEEERVAKNACFEAGVDPELGLRSTSGFDTRFPALERKGGGEPDAVRPGCDAGALDVSSLQPQLTRQHLRQRERFQRNKENDKKYQKSQQIQDWASKLGSSPPTPSLMPTPHDIEAMHNFRGVSFEPVDKPRRSSVTQLRRAQSNLSIIGFSPEPAMPALLKRRSLPSGQDNWDLTEVLRPQFD